MVSWKTLPELKAVVAEAVLQIKKQGRLERVSESALSDIERALETFNFSQLSPSDLFFAWDALGLLKPRRGPTEGIYQILSYLVDISLTSVPHESFNSKDNHAAK